MPAAVLTTEDLLHETPNAIAKEESLQGGTSLWPLVVRRFL